MLRPTFARAEQARGLRPGKEARYAGLPQDAYPFCRSIASSLWRAGVFFLLAFILFPLEVLANGEAPLAKIEDYELRSVIGKIQETAYLGSPPGSTGHSGYKVRVLRATDLFQDRTICHQSWQTKIFILASENGEEFPTENVWTLPLGCGWEFNRWVSFPESGKWDGLTVLEFIRELEDDSQSLYHVSVNPYEGIMEEITIKDAAFYPPKMGYEKMDWGWKDHFVMGAELAKKSNELFSAKINIGKLNDPYDYKKCSGHRSDVVILSIDQRIPARSSGQSFFLCLDEGDWTFGEWTLTGKESIEAGYLGFTLVDRESKQVRHILCNPWTAYVK